MGKNSKRKRKIKNDKGEIKKMKIKNELKNKKGITLIALVITIIDATIAAIAIKIDLLIFMIYLLFLKHNFLFHIQFSIYVLFY